MNKRYWDSVLKSWFNLTDNTKIVYYRNPNDCSDFQVEKVDGSVHGLIWGRTKNKTKNWIRICQIFFSNAVFVFVEGIRNFILSMIAFINYVDMPIFICYIIMAFLFYQFIFYLSGIGIIPFLDK